MAFYAESLVLSNDKCNTQTTTSLQSEQYKSYQPHRELSSFLLNELRSEDFFQDTYVASDQCLSIEYDLDELITLSKQLQHDHRTVLSTRDGRSSESEGAPCSIENHHHHHHNHHQQHTATEQTNYTHSKKSELTTPPCNEPYSLVGIKVKANSRSLGKQNTCQSSQQHVSSVQCSGGSGIFYRSKAKRPKLQQWNPVSRPVPKRHSCVVIPVQRQVKGAVVHLSKPADYYNFEKTHPNLALVTSDTLFPKRVTKCENVSSVDLGSSEIGEETLERSTQSVTMLTKPDDVVEPKAKDPTWRDVLGKKKALVACETFDKEVQVSGVDELHLQMLSNPKEKEQPITSPGTPTTRYAIQVLPSLYIRRECRVQRLPDVSIASANGSVLSNIVDNNAYLELVYCEEVPKSLQHDEIHILDAHSSDESHQMPKEVSSRLSLENVLSNGKDAATDEIDNADSENKNKTNSEDKYSTSFEVNSSLHDSQLMTDDEKASFAENSMCEYQNVQSKLQAFKSQTLKSNEPLWGQESNTFPPSVDIQQPSSVSYSPKTSALKLPSTPSIDIASNNGTPTKLMSKKNPSQLSCRKPSEKQRSSSKSPKIEKHNAKDIEISAELELTPVISTDFLRIIDQIIWSSPEDQVQIKVPITPATPEPTFTAPITTASTMAFGKSAIFEMVHENWSNKPTTSLVDIAVQTFPGIQAQYFQNTAVQTDALPASHQSTATSTVDTILDRIRNDNIAHWQQPTITANARTNVAAVEIGTQTTTELNAMVPTKHQFIPLSVSNCPPEAPKSSRPTDRPWRQNRHRPISHSPDSSSSEVYRHVANKPAMSTYCQHVLPPSERLTNLKLEQHQRQVKLQHHPKVQRTIESICNEAAERTLAGIGRRSLNSTFRSTYANDDIEVAAQRFLNSVRKARVPQRSTFPRPFPLDWYRTDSSSTRDSSSNRYFSMDETPSSESGSAVERNARYLCTNSEASFLSTNGSPVRRNLSFRSTGLSPDRTVHSVRNVTPASKFDKNKLSPMNVEAKLVQLNFKTTKNDSSSAEKITSLHSVEDDTIDSCVQRNSTSSSIEGQVAQLKGFSSNHQFSENHRAAENQLPTVPMQSTEHRPFTEEFQVSVGTVNEHYASISPDKNFTAGLTDGSLEHQSLAYSGDWNNPVSTSSSIADEMAKMKLSDVLAIN